MIDYNDVRKKWMQDPEFVKEYEALEEEFSLASAMIAARAHADMTQQDVAAKMETPQSYMARLEGGAANPTMKARKRFAEAAVQQPVRDLELHQSKVTEVDIKLRLGALR